LTIYNEIKNAFDGEKYGRYMLRYGVGINPASISVPNLLLVGEDNKVGYPCSIISAWGGKDQKTFCH
jgi:hypothetical protein